MPCAGTYLRLMGYYVFAEGHWHPLYSGGEYQSIEQAELRADQLINEGYDWSEVREQGMAVYRRDRGSARPQDVRPVVETRNRLSALAERLPVLA
jgi:hypothetical protein